MSEKFNTISFCRDDYKEYYDCLGKEEVNCDKMFDDIKEFIRIALRNGYQMRIWDDGLTIVVEFNYQDENMSGVGLEWLNENEYVASYAEGENE